MFQTSKKVKTLNEKKLLTYLTPTSWKFNLFKLKSEKKTFYQNLSVVREQKYNFMRTCEIENFENEIDNKIMKVSFHLYERQIIKAIHELV